MAKCEDDDTMLMVISDHGFNAFRYGVDLNKWLLDNGYLYVIDGSPNADYLTNIDWSRTRAYATGLAGLYLNIKGREAKGIVKAGLEADTLRDEICKKLTGLRDEAHNDIAIKKAYNALKAYVGPYKTEAPDIIVGYNKGYRVSWETAVGRLTDTVILDNIKAWSGDHCIDPSLVPGVLFCNRNIEEREPRLMDLAPTTLNMFGVTPPANMDGKPLNFVEEKKAV
jgi:predicted AlkP superfamily phosphohydrolase/phosphomutase